MATLKICIAWFSKKKAQYVRLTFSYKNLFLQIIEILSTRDYKKKIAELLNLNYPYVAIRSHIILT